MGLPRDGAAAEPGALLQFQRGTLEQRATATGVFKDLLYFLAVLGEWGEIQRYSHRLSGGAGDDRLMLTVLNLPQTGEDAAVLAERAAQADDPWFSYSIVKRLLAQDRPVDAIRAATLRLTHDAHDTLPLNLCALTAACRNDAQLAGALAESSLRLNDKQNDMRRLLDAVRAGAAVTRAPYLELLPARLKVAFYLPVYKVEQYIEAAIRGIAGLSYPLSDLIVVDDASPDRSMEIARAFPITPLRHPENKGLAAARNTAFRNASAELIGAIDTDAYPGPDYVKNALMEFETGPDHLAAVGGKLDELHQETPADKWRHLNLNQGQGPRRKYACEALVGSNILMKRAAVLESGGYDEKYRTNAEDIYICRAMSAAGYEHVYNPYCRAYHGRRDTVRSVLDTAWNWGYWGKREAGVYDSAGHLLTTCEFVLDRVQAVLARDCQTQGMDLLYLDLLTGLLLISRDLNEGVRRGVLTAFEARGVQDAVWEMLERLDAAHGAPGDGQSLAALGSSDLAGLRLEAQPEELVMRPAIEAWLAGFRERISAFCAAVTPDMYRAMVNTAQCETRRGDSA